VRREALDRRLRARHVARRQLEQLLAQPDLLGGDLGVARHLLAVDDRRVEPGAGAVVEEDRVEHLAAGRRQAEGDVRDAEHGAALREVLLQQPHRLDRRRRRADVGGVAGGAGEDQRVPPDVLGGEAVLVAQDAPAPPRHLELPVGGHRHPLLVDGADHHGGAEAAGERHHGVEAGAAVLEVDRVEDRAPLAPGQRPRHHRGVGRVDHQRHLDHPGEAVEEGLDVGRLVAVGVLQADVDHLRAAADLRPADLGGALPVAGGDQLLEGAAAEHVGALADEQRPVVVGQLDRLEAGDQRAVVVRQGPRRPPRRQLGQRRDVRRRGAAAAADQVEPAGVEEAAEDAPEVLGALGVAAVLVGQPGVGHAGDAGAGELGQRAQVVGHALGAGGAVEPQVEEVGVEQRHGERLGVLAGEHGAGGLDGRRHGDRQPPAGGGEGGLDAEQAGLDVARVLRRLEQQVVGAAGHQPQRLDAEVLLAAPRR
jgi:hypothetical protein